MESKVNCSFQCDSHLCLIHSGVNRQEALDVLQRLCALITRAVELPKRYPSTVLYAVVWTLLSCGILLAFFFLLFTLRFRNNRIVKMSSPNLNVLTLFGSVLTYVSGFLFAVDGPTLWPDGTSTAVIWARTWLLCIGSTLVFGPILGKTWRLYRVFTQRVPDKRVIIRDIQLMGLVGLLILVDMLVLAAWNLTDPIICSRALGAVVKALEKDMSYSLRQLDSCSSVYSDLWVFLIAALKGSLLLYGTYLAGLTSNVSHPPVNQSPTIITAVSLVTLSSMVAVPVSIFLQAWPNLVYSTMAGAIFICTLATNCLLFVPQLTQCRQFEDDQNNPGQMAKYFSSPSKSQASAYSQDEIYHLLRENSSIQKLLSEKNAVIDSLQEQVNNAKDKLLRLVSASQPHFNRELDSSSTNLHSSSTQTTVILQSDCPPTPPHHRDPQTLLSPSPRAPTTAVALPAVHPSFPEPATPVPVQTTAGRVSSPLPAEEAGGARQMGVCHSHAVEAEPKESSIGERCSKRPLSLQPRGSNVLGGPGTEGEAVSVSPSVQVNPPHVLDGLISFQEGTAGCQGDPASRLVPGVRQGGFVSSEQLQEILQELSVAAAMETALSGQLRTSRRASELNFTESSLLSPLSLRTPRSPVLFSFPSISPHRMRKRRPPFRSPRGGLPPCFHPGPEPSGLGRRRGIPRTDQEKPLCRSPARPAGVTTAEATSSHVDNGDIEEADEEEEEEERKGEGRRDAACHGAPGYLVTPRCAVAPSDVQADGETHRQSRRLARDSYGYCDSDSSSSADYCYYHRPYCDSCLQRGSFLSSDSSSDSSSDCEYGGYMGLYPSPRPVVFKEDLKPTFV